MILYSQQGCPQCKMIHMLLDKTTLQYEECQDFEKMKAVGIQHTPAMEVDGKILVGRELMEFIKREGK